MSSLISRACPLVLAATFLVPFPWMGAHADWIPSGNPTGATAWWGADPSVAADGSGGAFVSWARGVCAGVQHFESTGERAPGWPAAGLPTRRCNGIAPVGDRHTRTVPDGSGGAYVASTVWQVCVSCQAHPMYVLVQRLRGDGTCASEWPADGLPAISLNPWPGQTLLDRHEVPRLAASGEDGVFIAWQAWQPRSRSGSALVTGPLYAQFVAGNGTRPWSEHGLLLCRANGVRSAPEIVPDGRGGAFVFWCEQRPEGAAGRVFGQHVDATGECSWAPDGIPVSESYRLRLVSRPERTAVLAPPFAISDGVHGAIVSWAGARGADMDVFASRITAGGALPWGADVQVCKAPGDQFDARMVLTGREGQSAGRGKPSMRGAPRGVDVIFGWMDSRSDGVRVSAQRLTRSGRIDWGPEGVEVGQGEIVATFWAPRSLLSMAGDGSDGAFLVWPDTRADGRLFGLRIGSDGQPASGWAEGGTAISDRLDALASANMAEVGDGNAVVAWQTTAGTSWVTMLSPRGPAATLASPDLAVAPGGESFEDPPGEEAPPADRASSTPPWSPRLTAGDSSGELELWLPDASPATLELFDVLGRRLWSRQVGVLGGGEHHVWVGDGAMLPTGVYLARLTQRENRASVRLLILH